MGKNQFVPQPQVDSAHYSSGYDHRGRWSSYWLQIQHAAVHSTTPILEIGIGSGIVTSYLRTAYGASVTTVDIDRALEPDFVADITSLPFEAGQFGCVIACEVLEHVPFEQAQTALVELRRVSRHAVISVPNANRYYAQIFGMLGTRRARLISMSFAKWCRLETSQNEQHFWELERPGFPVSKFLDAITNAGWNARTHFRNPDHPYHHFFILD